MGFRLGAVGIREFSRLTRPPALSGKKAFGIVMPTLLPPQIQHSTVHALMHGMLFPHTGRHTQCYKFLARQT